MQHQPFKRIFFLIVVFFSSLFHVHLLLSIKPNFSQRRRTQIRLAQRAYRQRKETTISGLNRRVKTLEDAIEDMHNCFLAFNDRAFASGIETDNPIIAKHLRATAERLNDLANNSARQTEVEEEELDQILSAETIEVDGRQPKRRKRTAPLGPDRVPVLPWQTTIDEEANDNDGEVVHQAPLMQEQTANYSLSGWSSTAMQQYQAGTQTTNDAPSQPFDNTQQYSNSIPDINNMREFDAGDSMQYRVEIPEDQTMQNSLSFNNLPFSGKSSSKNLMPLGKRLSEIISLPSPKSYASQEASFARRLMRSSLEAGYRLLTDPNTKQEDLGRMCKLSWCFTTSPRIAAHMKAIMERTAKENLELWDVPERHIGGAGLHYPRVGIDAAGAPPEWWATSAPIGPHRLMEVETPVPEPDSAVVEKIVQRVGFDGEWFDSNDVEQYLRSKGLYLDGQSSVVELNEDETIPALTDTQGLSTDSPAASSTHESSGGPRSPRDPDTYWPNDSFLQDPDPFWSGDINSTAEAPYMNIDMSLGDTEFLGAKIDPANTHFDMFPDTMPTFNTKIKKFVDVEKFINSMYMTAVTF